MTTATPNKSIVLGGMVALSALVVLVDVLTPIGETFSILFVTVVGACMWLPGLRPIFVAAFVCTVLTGLIYFLESVPGPREIDLVNRCFAIGAIWVVAILCALFKRAEQRAQELAAIVASSEDAIYSRNLDGVITSWNAGAQRLFGYAPGEIVGRPIDLLIPPDRVHEVMGIIDALKRGERLAHFETVRKRKDGSLVPVSLSASAIADARGNVVEVSLIARDITERKRAAEELQRRVQETTEAEERMRSVVNHVVDGIITIDDRGTVMTFNPAAERIFGYAAPEVIGQNVKILMPEPYHSQHDSYLANYLRTGEVKIIGIGREVAGRRKDGSTFPMDLSISTFRLCQDQYFTGMVRDITERKQAEEAVRESEQRWRSLAEALPQLVWTDTPDGYCDYLSTQWEKYTGVPAAEHIGWRWIEALHPDDRERARHCWTESVAGRADYDVEFRIRRADGEYRWFKARGLPVRDSAGKIVKWFGTCTDITDLRQTQEALCQANTRLDLAVRGSNLSIWECDMPDGRIENSRLTLANVWELLGYDAPTSPADFPSAFALLFQPDDQERVGRELHELFASDRKEYESEYRVLRKDGSIRWHLARGTVLRDPHGKPVRFIGTSTDITDLKRAEEALRESEQRWRSLTEALPQLVWSATPDGTCDYFSAQWTEHTGIAEADLLGWQWLETLHPDDREPTRRFWLESVAGHHSYDIEYRVRRRDGEYRWFKTRGVPIRDTGGNIVKWFGTCTDITELRQSEARFRGTFENAAVGIAHEDLTGRFLRLNGRFCAILGYPPEELVGKTLSEVTHAEDLAADLANFGTLTRGESSSYTMEKRFLRKDGTPVWAQLTVSLQFDAAGKPAYCIKIIQDITDRKRAEEALRESERRFRTMAEALPHMVWTCEPDGTPDYKNTRHTEYTGLTLDQLRGRDWRLNLHPEDATRVHELFTRSIANGEPFEAEYRLRRADGAFRWHLGRVLALRDDSGRITKWFGSGVDIEDQKHAAEALREAKEAAEAANRAKSEFLASMSHEIRTPMNGVFGMLDLTLDTELQPEQRHYLERARASADLLLRVIDDILDFSKIEAGRLDLEAAPFSLRESLGEAIKAFGPRAHRKDLELALHVRPDTPDGVVGDAMRLGQILTNLLGNAIKFTDQGEVILKVGVESAQKSEVRSQKSEVGQESAGSQISEQVCLHFAVTDTGVGIPHDKQQLIFGAFAQMDSSMARRFGGTGLGLAISARLVELMGGHIWVESEVGKGSTFHFTACVGLHRGPVARPLAERIDLEELPVLAADDNETNRGILAEMLANWRMRPTTVGGGHAALAEMKRAAAAGEPFPLVLLDAVMPDMDGFAVAHEIKNDPALAGATIMMLTSADRGGELARCRELGIAAYLRKPVKQSELLNAILTAVGAVAAEADTTPTRPVPAPAARRGLRVLVAEDNEFNQELAANLLRKWGHVAVLADDGKAALAAWEREPFDLILMDVQMPDMDGFAVTEAIRARERAVNMHVPIIALTAHAMKGDRERCLAAGMDAYASKPIRAAELAEVMARLLPAVAQGTPATPGTEGPPRATVFDLDTALGVVDGDRELLRKMVEVFRGQSPKLLGAIRDSVLRGDGAALEQAAHKLKAAVGSFGAHRAYQAAQLLEELGLAGDVTGSQQAYLELKEAVERLDEALADFVK